MAYENVIVNAEEADDAAAQIDTGIKNLEDGINKLNSALNRFHGASETDWEERFHQEWTQFYTSRFPTAIAALKGQAANLRTAAQAARNLNR